jgi:hypothetical protein
MIVNMMLLRLSFLAFFSLQIVGPNDLEVIKSKNFKGNTLEAIYQINYKNKATGEGRNFEVVKCNAAMKHHFMSEFHLIERTANNSKIIYYPIGWEDPKHISEKELREDCSKIISGKMNAVTME